MCINRKRQTEASLLGGEGVAKEAGLNLCLQRRRIIFSHFNISEFIFDPAVTAPGPHPPLPRPSPLLPRPARSVSSSARRGVLAPSADGSPAPGPGPEGTPDSLIPEICSSLPHRPDRSLYFLSQTFIYSLTLKHTCGLTQRLHAPSK